MADVKSILLGVDLSDDYTQLSCFDSAGQLYSVSLGDDPLRFRVPTVLCGIDGGREWLYGDDAEREPDGEDCCRVTGLVKLSVKNETKRIFGREYTPDMLLARFFKRLFASVRERIGYESIRGVVVSVRTASEAFKRNLCSALEPLGLRGDRVRVITHLESFMYYTVSQNRDIWSNDVAMLDFDKDGAVFYKLSFGRRQEPITIVADSIDISDKMSISMLDPDNLDRLVFNFRVQMEKLLHKQILSSVFFAGNGFETSWADESLKTLCAGRRIFRGPNLFAKGAGYAAQLFFDGGAEKYLPVGDSVLKADISLCAVCDGEQKEIRLATIGEPACETGNGVDVILDDTNELDFIIRSVLKKERICATMTLDSLIQRKDRSVRVNIRLRFPNRDTCVITVRDVGFGEIYDTNYRIWEQVIRL